MIPSNQPGATGAVIPPAPANTLKSRLSEDWVAFIIGAVVITLTFIIAGISSLVKLPTPIYKWATTEDLFKKVLAPSNLQLLLLIGVVFLLLAVAAVTLLGGNLRRFVTGFGVVYLLGIVSLIIAGNSTISYIGLEYVIFGLLLGLAISNLGILPDWLREAARSEFYIKTGLVILGSSVLFTDIIKAGLPGILQAVIVVSVVWFFALWIARKLKVDDEFGVILASAVSICGVSAAIAASGAIKGDKQKLSYVTTLVLIVALPMLVLQPWLIRILHIPEIVGGAWLGGTLDTTASVTAAAQLVGPSALKAGVIVKFSQNVLIGVAALLLAVWWTFKKKSIPTATASGNLSTSPSNTAGASAAPESNTSPTTAPIEQERPGFGLIWERFPKFVLGFILVSILFSFFIPASAASHVTDSLNALRTIWFSLAFVCIGLEARFVDLIKLNGGRPALAFIGAQIFNVLWTLLWAYLLFNGQFLPIPSLK
ncbi:MAG: putative sulfate exporter family transporter [Bacteroidetes bacterium]|nr:putative sulfate exporter family transporter [Bacteroidota bacterium]